MLERLYSFDTFIQRINDYKSIELILRIKNDTFQVSIFFSKLLMCDIVENEKNDKGFINLSLNFCVFFNLTQYNSITIAISSIN